MKDGALQTILPHSLIKRWRILIVRVKCMRKNYCMHYGIKSEWKQKLERPRRRWKDTEFKTYITSRCQVYKAQ
jgi:hypothetical protein